MRFQNRKTTLSAHSNLDDSQSYLEEPPETPAPLFAVRAFKTAIFGTPHPVNREPRHPAQPSEKGKAFKNDSQAVNPEGVDGMDKENAATKKLGAGPKLDPFSSPAKGILLTPGTTATRRKTVSFLELEESVPEKIAEALFQDIESTIDPALTPPKTESELLVNDQPRQSKLTKTLIELSKQKLEKRDILAKERGLPPSIASQTDSPDITTDLNQPRSRSGQHWKSEYEDYHRRSSREIRHVIRYGQNVKSYAVKKDSEATSLAEKLEKELAKVARMEKKVTKLAAQLNTVQSQGPEIETEQQRLVGELAQQTALAIRYKQKADQYKAAIEKQTTSRAIDDGYDRLQADQDRNENSQVSPSRPDQIDVSSNTFYLQAQLDDLRRTAQAAEDHARKLERENNVLKRNLSRVKEEMMSYETRRQAREERLKKREKKHKAAREECEMQLAQLRVEHEQLLQASDPRPKVDEAVKIQVMRELHANQPPAVATMNRRSAKTTQSPGRASKPYISPRKRRLQNTAVDIWTLSSPNHAADKKSPSKELTQLPPSSVRHDIHRTLKEIDQNLLPEKESEDSPNPIPKAPKAPAPENVQASGVQRMNARKSFIDSPRPSMVNLATSPGKLLPSQTAELAYTKPSRATVGRSASLMSTRMGSRTSTMGSVRGSALPVDRAAAAKERLAKRSAEKRRRQASA